MKQKIVILLITTLIILTAYFIIIPVKANSSIQELKPVVLLKGTKNYSLLEEGYELFDNNVDTNVVGSYEVEYINMATKEKVVRQVEVIDLEKSYYKETMTTIKTFKDYPVELLYNESYEGKHLLIVKFVSDINKNTGYIFMYLVENNQIKNEVSLYYNTDLTIEDLKIIDDHFIMTGSMYNTLKGSYDVFVRVNRLDGLLLYDECFGGNNTDVGYQIVETKDSYIVAGKTLSNDRDFVSNINNDTNYIMSISKDKREIKNIAYNAESIDYNSLYLRNDSTDVYLCYNTPQNYTKVSKLNNLGVISESYLFSIKPSDVLKEVIISDEIEFIYINNDKVVIRSYVLGESITEKEIFVDDKIESIRVEKNKISMMVRNSTRSIYKVYNEGNLVYELLLDNSKYLLKEDGVVLKETKRINVYDINYLIINTLGDNIIDNEKGNYHNYQIIMNGDYVKHSTKTIDLVNTDELGCYSIIYVFENDFLFMVEKELYVYEDIGVVDGGVYDIGTVINTSSRALLNDETFIGEYVLNKEGSYKLILNGNNLTQELHFEVRNLSLDINIKNEKDTTLELEISEPILETEDALVNVSTITDTIDVVQNNLSFMYTLPIVLSIAFTFLIVKMKF